MLFLKKQLGRGSSSLFESYVGAEEEHLVPHGSLTPGFSCVVSPGVDRLADWTQTG